MPGGVCRSGPANVTGLARSDQTGSRRMDVAVLNNRVGWIFAGRLPRQKSLKRTLSEQPSVSRMDIGSFDLNLLKAFDALYAERHVTRAGLRIGLSQSAMSGALTRLRELLADELFVRTQLGMQPTARADDLAGPVSHVLRLEAVMDL